MKCQTCPRLLTHHDRDAGRKTCDVCRGVRMDRKSQAIMVSPPKQATTPAATRASWWTQLTSEELNAESRRRFTR